MNSLSVYKDNLSFKNQLIEKDLINRWEDYVDVRPRSKETYTKAIKQFMIYLKEQGINRPVREDIISWRDNLKKNHKPSTVQTYITSVRLFFGWLEEEGIYKNIVEHVKGVKIDKSHKRDYLTSEQSRKVLECIDKTTEKGIRNFAIIGLMLTTGLRTVEIVRANINDIRHIGGVTVLFVQGKGKDEKSEYVKIAPQVEEAINLYLTKRNIRDKDVRSDDEALFTSLSNNNYRGRMTTRSIRAIAKNSMKKAGYSSDRLTAHSMRHTAGTLALLNGSSVREVQQLLRHTNINTTLIYAHDLDRAKNNSELKVANSIF